MAITEADLDGRIRGSLTRLGGCTYRALIEQLKDVDLPRLEARLHYLQSSGQLQQLGGIWSAVVTERSPPPEPDHRRIPQTCFIAHQHSSEMASGVDPPARRNRITERPDVEPEPAEPPTPAAPVIEDPPMAKTKTCRSTSSATTAARRTATATSAGGCRGGGKKPAAPSARSIAEVAAKHARRPNGGVAAALQEIRAHRAELLADLAKADVAIQALEALA